MHVESHGLNFTSFNLPTPGTPQLIKNKKFDYFNEGKATVEHIQTLIFLWRAAIKLIENYYVTSRSFYIDGPKRPGKTYL